MDQQHQKQINEAAERMARTMWGSYETAVDALDAADKATTLLKEHAQDLDTSVIVGQIRTTIVDLLISTGMDQTQALHALEENAGRVSESG